MHRVPAVLIALLLAYAFYVPLGRAENAASDKTRQPVTTSFQPSIIALVDMQRIHRDSRAAMEAQKVLEAARTRFQARTATEEEALRKAERELAQVRAKLSVDDYARREQDLRRRFSQVERRVQIRRHALDKAFGESSETLRKAVLDAVSALARERGITVVIPRSQTLWGAENIDLTEDVLTHLNAALPTLTVVVTEDKVDDDKDMTYRSEPSDPVDANGLKGSD